MPETTIRSLKAEFIELPLHNPFVIAVRTATTSRTIRWTLETEEGQRFFGESVPVQYITGETTESVMQAAAKLETVVKGRTLNEFARLADEMHNACPADIAARAGVEIALYNAFCAKADIELYQLLGGAVASVQTDMTIAKLPNGVEIAQKAWDEGFRVFKMKVGGEDTEADLARVLEIHRALPEAEFRLDGNQGFSAQEAILFFERLDSAGVKVQLVEQPVPKDDLSALSEVAAYCPVPVIADEACKTAADAYRLFSTTAVHGVNVKLMKSGIAGALAIVRVAQAANKKLMIGCMLESPIGLAAALALTCGTGAFDYVDLDGHLLLNLPEPITEFHADGPSLSVERGS